MCDILPGGRMVRQRLPRHPQCFESETTSTRRGPTGGTTSHQAEYQRRLEASLQRVGINEGIQRIHGTLLAEAQRMGANMSYERFTNLGSDTAVARRLFDHVLQSTLDTIRDTALQRMLPQIFTKLLGTPLTYITGLQSIYNQGRWDSPNAARRNSFRTQQLYAHLIWVYASTAAEGNLQAAIRNNTILVTQGLNYLRWRDQELPQLNAWVTQNVPAIERGPTIGLPSVGVRRR